MKRDSDVNLNINTLQERKNGNKNPLPLRGPKDLFESTSHPLPFLKITEQEGRLDNVRNDMWGKEERNGKTLN